MTPLRLLFTHGPENEAIWRAGFDLAQASAALDLPLELGFAGDGLRLITLQPSGGRPPSYARFASLGLLDVAAARVPAAVCGPAALPLEPLDDQAWRDWLRRAPLQVW